MKNRVLSIITCLTLCLCLLPVLTQTVNAAEPVSYVERSWNGTSVVAEEKTTQDYIAITEEITAWENGKTYVATDAVTITGRVKVSGSATLILTDGCNLNASQGITVSSGNTLTIYAQDEGSGTLKATASGDYKYAAGIGGERGESGGTVIIHGGVISAGVAGERISGAGIGGGSCSEYEGIDAGDGGTVTIYHGVVTATSPGSGTNMVYGGAGIGGGGGAGGYDVCAGDGGIVNIYGGFVTAAGKNCGAGIGGGGAGGRCGGSGADVTISGGIVHATSGGYGSRGIGEGYGGKSRGTETIHSGIVYEGEYGWVFGAVTLTESYTVPAEAELQIRHDAALTIPEGVTLTVDGELWTFGTVQNNGTIRVNGSFEISSIDNTSVVNNGSFLLKNKNVLSGADRFSGNGIFQIEGLADDQVRVPEGLVYNGQDQTSAAQEAIGHDVNQGGETVCGVLFSYTGNWQLESVVPATVKDAGTYTVTWVAGSSRTTKNFSVEKANLQNVVHPSGTANLVYNQMNQALLAVPASAEAYPGDNVLVGYRLDSSSEYGAESPSAVDADTYTVGYKMSAGENYNDVTGTVTVSVAKKNIEVLWSVLTEEELVYNGQEKVITAELGPGVIDGDECDLYVRLYRGNNVEASEFGFRYSASLTNPNYRISNSSYTPYYVITPAPLTITALDQTYYVRTALPESMEEGTHYTVEGLLEGISAGNLAFEYQKDGQSVTPDNTRSGKYDIVPVLSDANPNYGITLKNGTLTIRNYPVSTYAPIVDDTTGGDTTVSNKNPKKGDKVTITTDPDKGYEVGEIAVTDKNGKPVEVIDNGDGTFTYVQPAGKVTIEVEYVPAVSGFTDVAEESYYYNAVNWAVANGITSGTSATTFSPNAACTRAQMATFLWRAAGSPEPKGDSNPSEDVTADAYYAKAVQWAVEQGITTGTSATTFSPNAACTRAQMATFIYRCEQANGGGFTGAWMFLLPFTDAPEWAYEPIAWCYKEGITSGTSATTFGPNAACTRAQMVTFLYRYFVE